MTSVASASSSASLYSQLFSTGSGSNWLADTITNIQNEANQGGLLGMLQNSGGDGSVSSFLGASSNTASNFALISQNSVVNISSLIAQEVAQNQQAASQKKLLDVANQLAATQQAVQPKNVLDPFIYLPDGSTIDTNNNIMTMANGTQYDTISGAKYVDPSSIIQIANGAYLDTKNNIMTEPDGTQIDTNTGLKISKTA
jgi:hypothetical protein